MIKQAKQKTIQFIGGPRDGEVVFCHDGLKPRISYRRKHARTVHTYEARMKHMIHGHPFFVYQHSEVKR